MRGRLTYTELVGAEENTANDEKQGHMEGINPGMKIPLGHRYVAKADQNQAYKFGSVEVVNALIFHFSEEIPSLSKQNTS